MKKHITFLIFILLSLIFFINGVNAAEINVLPGESIQNAINNASENDSINVYDNNSSETIYIENINITKKNLSIISKGNVTIKGSNPSIPVVYIYPGGNWTTIKGFNIINATNSMGIFVNGANNCYITDNTLQNNNIGIRIYNGANNTLNNNLINNTNTNVELKSASSNQITNNQILSGQYGVYLNSNSIKNYIFGNNITNSSTYPINLEAVSNNTIIQNNIIAINTNAINIYQGSNHTITQNNITTTNKYAINTYDSPNTSISQNNIKSAGNYAIYIKRGSNYTINLNNLYGSLAGIKLYNTTQNYIESNTIINNTHGIQLEIANNTINQKK